VKLDISEDAQADLDAILIYSVANWGAVRTFDYLEEMDARLQLLARGDLSGTPADDVAQGLRKLMAGAHVIWFRASDDAVRIVRVLHQRQDVDRDMA
jgi:toxin ParE1/3/4